MGLRLKLNPPCDKESPSVLVDIRTARVYVHNKEEHNRLELYFENEPPPIRAAVRTCTEALGNELEVSGNNPALQ
eukprot:6725859-Pyramimonas_sp.AAC.1